MTMAELSHVPSPTPQPPPAPPLPPGRAGGVFKRFIAPLSFNVGARQQGLQLNQSTAVSPSTNIHRVHSRILASQTTAHRTGIPIAAIDINKAKTHAILAGQEILKTVHVQDGRMVEDFNVRSGITSSLTSYSARTETANHRREYLPAKDVVWSKGPKYDTIIATAALNGRIALYDVSRVNSSRIELAWIHEHTGQVNKLDFDPTGGYLLLSGSQDKTVRIWDIREPQSVKRRQNINIRQPVRDVRWSPTDPGEFALCTENGIVQRWDFRMPTTALLSINAHEKACYAIDWHPDGRHLVSGGFDKYAKVWDLKSDNRRQKPAFSLRTPHAILNLRWRPPCWSSDLAEKGHWQSAQLATSYTEDDPRIHIWDLRRPLLPFKEHDRYTSRPTDMLWASQDFLWSVGNQGMFQQTDVRYASLVHSEVSTSAAGFEPDGGFICFSEDTRPRTSLALDDPAAGFLRIPQERLSGGNDGAVSRSFSDEDEGDEVFLTTSARRSGNKSSRSMKSQGNTPPTGDAFTNIVPLDRSVLNRNGLFNNEQIGIASRVTGICTDLEVVEFLAENYAHPMTMSECKRDASLILDRLRDAFDRNANACDYVCMHRTAQTWRMLGAVVIPEMRDWADLNRKERLENEAKRRTRQTTAQINEHLNTGPSHQKGFKSKIMSTMFKGVTSSELHGSEMENTSNMTTPIAKPLPDSPSSLRSRTGHDFLTLNDAIEPIPPLPPSVLSSHSTAAAAARALLDPTQDESPSSSPEQPKRPALTLSHRRAVTDIPFLVNDQAQSPKIQPLIDQRSKPIVPPSPRMEIRKQEDRRAAIRDFRAQQRTLLNFDEPIQSPQYNGKERHDSSESFQMFSASTDSSQRARSLGRSFDPPASKSSTHQESENWDQGPLQSSMQSSASVSSESVSRDMQNSIGQDFDDGSMQADFLMDETSRMDFGLDGATESSRKPTQPKPSAAASMWDMGELREPSSLSQSNTAASSVSGTLFPFEEVSNNKKLRIYTTNPIRRLVSKTRIVGPDQTERQDNPYQESAVDSKRYTYSDFRPIDFTVYDPVLPFAWSSLPLLCHAIAFDMTEGTASAQFSVHLLMHLLPFFFNPTVRIKKQSGTLPPDSLAERLMRPDYNYRIIEGLILNHYIYLKKMGMHRPMSELRKICVDFGYADLLMPGNTDQTIGASLKRDQFQVQISCSHCFSFMQPNSVVCQSCKRPRIGCPICLQLHETYRSEESGSYATDPQSLWTYCQACGHGAHWKCMQAWMLQPDAEGECPTQGCGCDCGPGLLRQQRITRQVADAEAAEMIRGARTPTASKRDPVRASHSPAVDKTRDTLRQSDLTRDSSGDERMRRSLSGRGGSRGGISTSGGTSRGASQSFGRRVRLVTPGEESGPSFSAS